MRALFPLINRRDDSPRNRFSITAEIFAPPSAPQPSRDSTCWVVSFPPGPSGPAQRIRPRTCLAVVQLRDRERGRGQPQDMTSWQLADDRSHFLPEEVHRAASARRAAGIEGSADPLERIRRMQHRMEDR